MSTKVTIMPTQGLEMVRLGSLQGRCFDHKDHNANPVRTYAIQGHTQLTCGTSAFSVLCLTETVHDAWLGLDEQVHPRPDIDALLAAQEPHAEPEVALEDVKTDEFYLLDGELCMAVSRVTSGGIADKECPVIFSRIKGLLCQTVIYSDTAYQHTIEAADVEIVAQRVVEEN
jgi:hypothetical protein